MDYRARWENGCLRLLSNQGPDLAEEWRPVPGAEAYSISSFGRVRRDAPVILHGHSHPPKPGFIRPRDCSKRSDHLIVTLSVNGKRMDRLVHRMVAEAFIGPEPEGKPFVCHRDGDPTNNHMSNLYWGNGTTNAADRTKHGRTLVGSSVGNSKLTEEQVLRIRSRIDSGRSQRSIAKEFGVSQSLISMIKSRTVWGHM